jgi:hypothetical protein
MENENTDNSGYIYILTSPKTECIKIGGTDYPPLKRIKEINSTEPYKSIGPWTLSDFRQVTDWRKVEYSLHYMFKSKLNCLINNQKELFHLSAHEASDKLNEIDTTMIISKPKIDRMFQDTEFSEYLVKLFRFTGLMNWLDIQGAWTFVLFPSTNGGRYFTINIGPHEVAFSTLSRKGEKSVHMILMDKLILDYDNVKKWIQNKNGEINEESYAKALPRSTSLIFEGSFTEVIDFLNMDGVRRALIAYWNEALIRLKENNKLSVFSRYHNWNAIAELHKKIIENV